ncbi:MAG: hypothetical protein K2J39_01030, partial [Ruminococcus sp.]|nr:hypothetical protein [Ruminococcus sp.]
NKISPYINYDIEKILLSEGIEIDRQIKMYLTEIQRVLLLTPETEKSFLQNLDDEKTRHQLLKGYIRFVVMIAKDYTGSMKLIDCIHNGIFGLIKATKSFDCTENISFAEHAEKYIRSEISNTVEHYEKPVRIPVFMYDTIERSLDENNSITIKKLAEVLKHNKFDTRQMYAIYNHCKKCGININSSADPYINYDVEKILSAEDVEICKDLKEYFTEIKRIVPYLTPETEKQLLQNLDDKKTLTRLSESYLRFTVMIAKEYIDGKNELIYLIAYGNEGLRKAVESFECTENISFAILAEWSVRQEILKGIRQFEEYKKIPIFYKRK